METCVTPARVALYGSGGRAAMVLAGLGSKVVLHTFQPKSFFRDLEANFGPSGIQVVAHPTLNRLCFEYLHPMSRPRITPLPNFQPNTIAIEGEKILRFGCLEGDFRITALQAVYDPQSGSNPVYFSANGSTAQSLGIILNASELRCMAGSEDLSIAALRVIKDQSASVLVVKDGPSGAYIFEYPSTDPKCVPAYPTNSVYKIGSGDVFSASFAHEWMSNQLSAADAADLASRRTAQYVESPAFPLPIELKQKKASSQDFKKKRVLISFETKTTSQRWVREQVIRGLDDLGAIAVLDDAFSTGSFENLPLPDPQSFDVVFAGAINKSIFANTLNRLRSYAKPIVVFIDDPDTFETANEFDIFVTSDLCSAIYRTQWVSL